jgi:hypothetical protein
VRTTYSHDSSTVAAIPASRRITATRLATIRVAVVIGLVLAVLGSVVTIGADTGWLAALGRIIVARGTIPAGVPFAAAPTAHWSNPLVLAELILHGLQGAGPAGLIVAQLVAVGFGLSVLAWDAHAAGARATSIAGVLILVAVGAFPSLAVVRVQLFSLALFPVMIALLRADARRPSNRIWLSVPLLALWSNLHGAVLSGLVVLYLYLGFCRLRQDRRTAIGVALLALPALCLTPAGLGTVGYFAGLVTNLAAERGVGQWAPLGQSPFDFVYVVSAIVLGIRLRRARPALWEMVVLIVLAALSIKAGRNGVWLIFFLAGPAASASRAGRAWNGLLPIGAVAAVALLALDVGHWSAVGRATDQAARRAISLAHGSPILGDGLLAEEIAVDGGRIWAGNPIDAFSRSVQGRYLDWLAGAGDGRAALANRSVKVVLVAVGSAEARLTANDAAFVTAGHSGGSELFVRRP